MLKTIIKLHAIIAFLSFFIAGAGLTIALADDAKLTEVQQLRADNHKLKVTLAQTHAQLNQCTLNVERADLTADFMTTLGGKPGDLFDWTTLTVVKDSKETK